MAMALTPEDFKSLEALGRELDSAGWSSDTPVAGPFEIDENPEQRRLIHKAAQFFKTEGARIRSVICDGNTVRPEIIAAGGTMAAVTDALHLLGSFPVPVGSIANTLSALGLTKFCRLRLD